MIDNHANTHNVNGDKIEFNVISDNSLISSCFEVLYNNEYHKLSFIQLHLHPFFSS